jgi:ankyrin repeat protein
MRRSQRTVRAVLGLPTAVVLGALGLGILLHSPALAQTNVPPERRLFELTYIANSGVMVAAGEDKVLIDALFDKPNLHYRAPSPEVLDKIIKGRAPSDGIDLAKHLDPLLPGMPSAVFGENEAVPAESLHSAAAGNDVAALKALLDRGALVDAKDDGGHTPLHIAAMNDAAAAATLLIGRGADIENRDDYGRTPLVLCARERGGPETMRVLVKAGANVGAKDKFGSTAIELAAWRGKKEVVDLLLDAGAGIPGRGPGAQHLLAEAAGHGLCRLFEVLVKAGADPAFKLVNGGTLLHAAAGGDSVKILDLLIASGLDVSLKDNYGWTPLHYAARDGRIEMMDRLIARGANVGARTAMGQSPLNVADERKHEKARALLIEKGAKDTPIQFPVLEGDYLGQKPPAGRSELFAPGIVASIWGLHSTAVFSPDGDEVYWAPMMTYPGETYSRGGLLMMKRVNGRWTPPGWAPFSGPDFDDDVPFFSGDGRTVYFVSRRTLPGEEKRGKERIWLARRTPAGWSVPEPLDAGVNAHDMHWEFSLDSHGNLYFGGQGPDSRGMTDIYLARSQGGKYAAPVNLGEPINSGGSETTPFIAPDGSYLLFSRQYDIWVSFRAADGAWDEPVKLGTEVNSPSIELCPIVTADGKYLFFLSQRGGESHPYWVGAEFIEKLRPNKTAQEVGDRR